MNIATLTRFIIVMLAALLAPAGAVARVRGFNRVQLWLFADYLAKMHRRGETLRHPGESLAIVYARLDLIAWICVDPTGAARHLARRARGWRRARFANRAPPSFAPPRVPCVVWESLGADVACVDSS